MKNGAYTLILAPDGYPGKKYRGRYAYEHHVVWWKETEETIDTSRFQIHHINEDRYDNRFENLEKKTISEHGKLHAKTVELIRRECGFCGKDLMLYPSKVRFYEKHGRQHFCSRSCGAKKQWADGRVGERFSSSTVERRALNPADGGSNPSGTMDR